MLQNIISVCEKTDNFKIMIDFDKILFFVII